MLRFKLSFELAGYGSEKVSSITSPSSLSGQNCCATPVTGLGNSLNACT